MSKMIPYEQSKCVSCEKVYLRFMVIDLHPHEKDRNIVICFGCAKLIQKAMDEILKQ